MAEYGFFLTFIIPYKDRIKDPVLIRENTGQKKPQGYDQKRKLFRTNSCTLISEKNLQHRTLKSSIQLYHMAECDVI